MKKRYVALIVVALLLMLLGPLFQKPAAPTSFAANPPGAKAFFLFLSQVGTPVEQWLYPFKDLVRAPQGSVLILAAPITPVAGHQGLLDWVRKGNTLVLLDDQKNSIFDALDLEWKAAEGRQLLMQAAGFADQGVPVNCSGEFNSICEGVRLISTPLGHFETVPAGAQILAGTTGNALAVGMALDRGKLFAFPGPEPLLNSNIDKFDNLRLLFQIVSSGKRILIDEFHHGFTAPVAAENAARWDSILMLSGYLTLLLVLAALSRSVRFGPPTPELPAPHSSSVQFTQALGLLYAENGAQDMLKYYRAAWRSRLQRAFGIPTSLAHSSAVEELLHRRLLDAASAAAIIRTFKAIDAGEPLEASQLQALERIFTSSGEINARPGDHQ